MAQLAPSKHRAIMRLRRKLLWRRYTKNKGTLVGLFFAIFFFLPMFGGAAFSTWIAYTNAPDQWPIQIMGSILIALWLGWIIVPIIALPVAGGIDLEKLLIFPLKPRDYVLSNLLGTLYDTSTYVILPFFLAIIVAFSGLTRFSIPDLSPLLLPYAILVCLISYMLMVSASQLSQTALAGALKSRQLRDFTIVIFAILGSSCGLLAQFIGPAMERLEGGNFDPATFADMQTMGWMRWFPTGALAHSLGLASETDWLGALVWLGYALIWAVIIFWAWSRLLHRLLTGNGFIIGGLQREQKVRRREMRDWTWLERLGLSPQTGSIFEKELRSIWRIPQRRIVAMQSLFMPIMFFVIFVVNTSAGVSFNGMTSLTPFFGMFVYWILSANLLGWEHNGFSMLLQTPVSRRDFFLGKGLAIWLFGLIPLVGITVVMILFSGDPIGTAPALIPSILVGLPLVAVGMVTSARFPYQQPQQATFNQSSFSRGTCLGSIIMMTLSPISMSILAIPILLPQNVSRFINLPAVFNVGLTGLVIVYAVAVFVLAANWAGDILSAREPETWEAVRPTDNEQT